MKRIFIIMVLGALMACLIPATAQNVQQDQWRTSSMQGSGSAYAPQVTAVGATTATQQATTTESYSPAKVGGPRRSLDSPGDWGQSTESPIGDAVLPLLFLSLAFCAFLSLRRRKALSR